MNENPGLDELVERLPEGISTAKTGDPAGIFVCRRIPVLTKAHDEADPEWSIDPGQVEWALRTPDGAERALHIVDTAIAAEPHSASKKFSERAALQTTLRDFERGETKRLRKETQLPLDAPAPKTICWMEVQ